MPAVTLRMLGAPAVIEAGESRAVPLSTPSSLLFYLAVQADWITRSELAYLYRPDEPEASALTYLRLQLHRAQQYPWAGSLEVEQDRLRWLVETDVDLLRTAAREQRWSDAIEVYGGTLLKGAELRDRPTYNAWLDLERDACRRLFETAVRHQAQGHEAGGRFAEAAELYRRLIDLDEFEEPAHVDYMRTLALTGRSQQALAHYDSYVAQLAMELDAQPSRAAQELADTIRSGAVHVARPPLHRAEAVQQPTTRFIGRRDELSVLAGMLDDPACRLVTLVGLGGSGKTRLLLELEQFASQQRAAETHFVPLSSESTVERAIDRVARAVGLEGEPGGDVAAALISHLSRRQVLLFLDNVEHLPDLGQFVARAMGAAPHLKVIASSRSSFNLRGEWLYDVRGLDTPPEGADDASVANSDAVELFVSAARRVAPRIAFTEEDLELVARICRQVDGLPLAIELAAAWVRALPLDRILGELTTGRSLLSSDALDIPERHRNLTAILDKTWSDLSSERANALGRLSVFQGGFTLEAAEAVTGAPLPVLLSLINQSLLTRDVGGRLSSHPLVAQYGFERLQEDPEQLADALDRHARFYAAVLHAVDPRHLGRRPSSSLAYSMKELETDAANLERAWFRLLETSRFEEAFDVVEGLVAYYVTRGHYTQGAAVAARSHSIVEGSVGASGPSSPRAGRLECSLLLAQATFSREIGDLTTGLELSDRALAVAEANGMAQQRAIANRYRGDMLQTLGRFEEAGEVYGVAIGLLEELDDPAELGNTLNSLASMEAVQEKFDSAAARFERCIHLFGAVGNELDRAIALNNLGYIADAQGDKAVATLRYEQSLEAFQRIHFTRGISAVKNNLVVLYGALGRFDEAERLGHEALAHKEQMNDRLGTVVTLRNLGELELLRNRPERALVHLRPAMKLAIEFGATPRLLQVLVTLAETLRGTGDEDLADSVLRALLAHPASPPSLKEKVRSLTSTPADVAEEDETLLADLLPRLTLLAAA